MVNFFEWMGHAFALYQVARDSGAWLMTFDSKARENYLESFFITKKIM